MVKTFFLYLRIICNIFRKTLVLRTNLLDFGCVYTRRQGTRREIIKLGPFIGSCYLHFERLYEPSFSEEKRQSPREKLNKFLASRDISRIRHSLDKPWIEASERTKRHYARKARQTVIACLNEIAPADSEMLLSSLVKSKLEESTIDSSLMECLTECYNNATHWSTRRQILSIISKICRDGFPTCPGIALT